MNDSPGTWRLIPPLLVSGPMQMAIDKWLLQQHCRGEHPSTLRFYQWESATISLGYHQHRYPEFWQQLSWQGKPIELVKRPSGGRAVLHQGDLTYTVVTSEIKGNRKEAYQQICQFLIEGWRSLNLELHYGSAGRGYIHNPNCFGTATDADLVTSQGCKLIGSAQLRRDRAILQHGSMRLQPNPDLFFQVFGETIHPLELPIPPPEKSLTQAVIEALTLAASQCFGVEFIVQPFSEEEWQSISQERE